MRTEEYYRRRDAIAADIIDLFDGLDTHIDRMNLHIFLRNILDRAYLNERGDSAGGATAGEGIPADAGLEDAGDGDTGGERQKKEGEA